MSILQNQIHRSKIDLNLGPRAKRLRLHVALFAQCVTCAAHSRQRRATTSGGNGVLDRAEGLERSVARAYSAAAAPRHKKELAGHDG